VHPRRLLALVAAALVFASAPPAWGASTVSVYPSPGTKYNQPATQISFRGVAPGQIGQVQVVGSASGQHAGTIKADSDNDGASFVPSTPFTRGERVTIRTSLNILGGNSGTFTFAIARTARAITPERLPLAQNSVGALQQFRSRPDLQPPTVVVDKNSAPSSEGDIFLSPQNGPAQNGPMILGPRGNLVWFQPTPVSTNTLVTDFRPQTLQGQPVLTWWQGFTNHGSGRGQGIIFDRNYRQIAVVNAGNGLAMDLHQFLVTSQGQAWVIAFSPTSIPGFGKPVMDSIVQEIDIATGLVMFEWHALDHVPIGDSFFPTKTPGFVYDPYHLNSAQPSGNSVLISMRNTNAVYDVSLASGQVMWQLGGKHSSFKLGKGVSTAFQHDAEPNSSSTITMFDDGAGPPTLHPFARGIKIVVDTRHKTASLIHEYDHSPNISTNFEGNVQQLGDGNVFLGWGQQPYFSEDNASGQQIFDGHFTVGTTSYRAYRAQWSAQPPTQPAMAVGANGDGSASLYASWNGATSVTAWRALGGTSPTALAPVSRANWNGFETAVKVQSGAPYFAVQALGSRGQVLATSPAQADPPHVGLFGHSAFVSSGGTGAVPAGCYTGVACGLRTTVTAGSTVIARTGTEAVGAGSGGLVFFSLSGTGRSMLAKARGHRLTVQVSTRDTKGASATTTMTLVPFSTRGSGPARSVSQSPTLQILGRTDFVNSSGVGGILASCVSASPCAGKTKIAVGKTVIATTGTEVLGANQVGYLFFNLTAAGRSMLDHAGGNQLGTTVTVTVGSATASAQLALVRFS
jgi:hypothetical protein